MSTLATLVVKLAADTGDFREEMDKSSGMVGRWTSGIKSNVQGLGKVALGGLAAFTGLAAGAGVALGKMAADAAQLETIEGAFRGIAESSGESADAMLAALERGSSGMIAQRDLMTTYNKAAQLVGTTFANQLPDAMQYLQKVSAATGQDMGFMLDSLVTGVGRLSPMILDNLGIQVALSEATDRAAQMFGVEADQLTKAQQQAGMTSVVLEKLQANTAAMPDVADSAAAGIARMRAKFQNLKDNLGRAFLPVLMAVMGVVGKLAEKVGPILVAWVGKFAGAVEKVVRPLAEWGWNLKTFFTTFEDGSSAISGFFTALGLGEETAFAIGDAINSVAQTIMSLIESATPWVEQIWEWIQNNIQLKDVLMALGLAILSVVVPAIVGIVAALLPLIATAAALVAAVALVRQAWESNWLGIRSALAGVIAWVQENWPRIKETIVNVLSTIQGIVGPIISALVTFATEMFGKVVSWVQQNWPLIQEAISDTINTVQTIIQTVLDAIYEFWITHGERVLGFVRNVWTVIQYVVEQGINLVLGVIKAVMLLISGHWKEAWELIKSAVANIWNTMVDWFQNTAGPFLWRAVTTILEKIPEIVLSIGELLYGAGRTIIEKLKDGLASKLEEVKQWFADRLAELRNMLPFSEPKAGARSPLYGLARSGEAFWANWLAGAQRAMPRVEAALEGMTMQVAGAVQAVQPAAVGAGGGGGVHIYGGVTVTGVQDGEGLLRKLQGLGV